MRCLNKNKAPLWYALYKGKTEMLDAQGRRTGQYRIEFENPVKVMANISAAKGETATRQFGEEASYDRVIVIDDPRTPIDELAVLWIDNPPAIDEYGVLKTDQNGSIITPHDYAVKQVARSLNSASIAIGKVNVSG